MSCACSSLRLWLILCLTLPDQWIGARGRPCRGIYVSRGRLTPVLQGGFCRERQTNRTRVCYRSVDCLIVWLGSVCIVLILFDVAIVFLFSFSCISFLIFPFPSLCSPLPLPLSLFHYPLHPFIPSTTNTPPSLPPPPPPPPSSSLHTPIAFLMKCISSVSYFGEKEIVLLFNQCCCVWLRLVQRRRRCCKQSNMLPGFSVENYWCSVSELVLQWW